MGAAFHASAPMRILYLDLDSQRPDHLGCYGYHRETSPCIDAIAAEGVRFTNCYAPDAPCLPSRTALYSGQHGIHTGVINHGGAYAQPFVEGPDRAFQDRFRGSSFPGLLGAAGYYTACISPFGNRHAAWHWMAGFNEMLDPGGKGGMESADEVAPAVVDWIERNAGRENWFLHVNLWDAHTPYRAPAPFGNPFADEPLPAWYTEEVRQKHWGEPGPHSAQEVNGFFLDEAYAANFAEDFPRQPHQIDSLEAARAMFDGYDCGVRYSDQIVGQFIDTLKAAGIWEDTVVIISADHGENLGELNIYGDHQTADAMTCRIPLIIRWPGLTDGARAGTTQDGLLYNFDWAATVLEMLGAEVPADWDGQSFAPTFQAGEDFGRPFLVSSQGAWSCQRGVRWGDYILVRSYFDAYHGFPEVMLFDLKNDPHEQHDLAPTHPELVHAGLAKLDHWWGHMMRTAAHPVDPMWAVVHEGGPYHARIDHRAYMARLRETGRARWADHFDAAYGPDGLKRRG